MLLTSSLPLGQLTSRVGHSGIFHNDKVYLFGGFVNSELLVNDLIQVDVSSQKWENKTIHNRGPSARNFHSSCLVKRKSNDCSDEMVIFGGKSNGFHNDVWSYRFDTFEWGLLEPSGDEIITPRYGQSATIYGDYLVVFGGYDDNNSFPSNELFIFNLKSREWKLMELSIELMGRYYHASVLDEETGDWYILGGKSATDLVKDFVKIKLSTLDVKEGTCQSEVLISELDGFAPRFGHSLVLEKSENGKRLYSIGGCNDRIDHLDCIYIDLINIKNGWDVSHTHSLSQTFTSQDVGPVFHTTVPFQATNEDDSIAMNYFVFGGTYHKIDKKKQVNEPTEITIIEPVILRVCHNVEVISTFLKKKFSSTI
ncbi:predicted protein [Naegleria gruberi]|uniref:Predicted protein n=1 Tax=Naegleria gruberi TaxID=5762 RepID=D2V2T2_NAEGR|nr:uncharacterized protein NAEGRDRAFT_63109 [Naegleria gruberi]EFC49114.1 predicted protein [Naegleria gruberi]|eukprot:XP_002681858.1 predicted protein [Naegleria gruberi strain NEG-M]